MNRNEFIGGMRNAGKLPVFEKNVNIVGLNQDSRLPISGIPGREAVRMAREWWDAKGRDVMRKGELPAYNEEDRAKSGIFAGRPFDELERYQKFFVVDCWHKIYLYTHFGITDETVESILHDADAVASDDRFDGIAHRSEVHEQQPHGPDNPGTGGVG